MGQTLIWTGVAQIFGTTFDIVFRVVNEPWNGGGAHSDYSGIEAIGIDEIQPAPAPELSVIFNPRFASTRLVDLLQQ